MTTKADLEREAMKRAMPIVRQEPDWKALAALPREHQITELMSLNWTPQEIRDALGYKNRATVNAQIQRIRRKMGAQAVW